MQYMLQIGHFHYDVTRAMACGSCSKEDANIRAKIKKSNNNNGFFSSV